MFSLFFSHVNGLTEDARDNNSLDVGSAGLVGVSREISNVQAESRVVAQDAVEIWMVHVVSMKKKRN